MLIYRRIRNFLTLHPTERQLFLKVLYLLPMTALRVQRLGLKETTAWLNRARPPANGGPAAHTDALAQAHRTAQLAAQAVRYSLVKGKCLSQSIVLWHLLKCQGIHSDLRIGVKKVDDRLPFAGDNFDAHAWVEYQGELLNERPDVYERFAVIQHSLFP
jgi:hypothetical protein